MNKIIPGIILLIAGNMICFQYHASAQVKKFRASVIKVDITPSDPQYLRGYAERKSTGVLDPIHHRIVVLDDGEKQFFLVSTEVCVFSPSLYDKVAARLKKEYNIDPLNFWWSVTHTHSAPEIGSPGISAIFMPERFKHPVVSEYTDLVERKLIDGISEARRSLVPARLGVGWGFSQANINRRAIDVDGKATLGLNPDGPVDRRIGLMRIDREDGTPLVLIANYPIHGTVMSGENLRISGDAPGIVAEYIEQKTGAPLLFINGAAGNLAPIYSVYPDPRSGHLSQFRVLLGDRILEANRKITSTVAEVRLSTAAITVETRRKAGMGWTDELGSYTRTTGTGEHLVRLPIRFLRINEDIAIWSAPLELFCEISNDVRNRSPFPYTFYYGYTNGNLGYLLAESEYEHGGYEPGVSPFTNRAEADLTEAVVNYLAGEVKIRHSDE